MLTSGRTYSAYKINTRHTVVIQKTIDRTNNGGTTNNVGKHELKRHHKKLSHHKYSAAIRATTKSSQHLQGKGFHERKTQYVRHTKAPRRINSSVKIIEELYMPCVSRPLSPTSKKTPPTCHLKNTPFRFSHMSHPRRHRHETSQEKKTINTSTLQKGERLMQVPCTWHHRHRKNNNNKKHRFPIKSTSYQKSGNRIFSTHPCPHHTASPKNINVLWSLARF